MPAINHEARGKIDDMAINFIAKSLRHCPADSQQKRADEINDEGEERLIESSHCVGSSEPKDGDRNNEGSPETRRLISRRRRSV